MELKLDWRQTRKDNLLDLILDMCYNAGVRKLNKRNNPMKKKPQKKEYKSNRLDRKCKCGSDLSIVFADYRSRNYEFQCIKCNSKYILQNKEFYQKDDDFAKVYKNPELYKRSQNPKYKDLSRKILEERESI